MMFRNIDAADSELQKALLLIALWTPEDEPDHTADILEQPHIKEYYENWGGPEDIGFFALDSDQQPMGIIQVRPKSSVTRQYSEFPELAMAVHPDYQGRGVGKQLLAELFRRITVPGLRLGVHPENRAAIALYKKFGFCHYETPEKGFPQMVWHCKVV
ncbi:GNAT family N-acetyltransferase [Vibrio sp. JC009]|uniref:GNAT family N-acetyltransferase n=1 Tax=Vibrio sp. JC009 TaxID=2912314 RepID=UPI0023B14FB7|nr:GNAT family N-acetyltransferase [Vibrio sp. JC009]WED24635.1 GNAT family N-acetyltransferase [Vibrio sp. JC009]